MKKTFITLSLILVQCIGFAQDSVSIYQITNALGVSECSRAIYKGKLLTNINYTYSEWNTERTNYNYSSWNNGPYINIGYGLTKRVDLHVNTGYFSSQSRYSIDTEEEVGHSKSWSGIYVGTKVNLTNRKKWIPESAVSLDFSFPYLNNNLDLSKMELNFAWSYLLGSNFRLGGNFSFYGYFNNISARNVLESFHYSINARYEIIQGFGAFVEMNLPKSFGGTIYNPYGGLYYRLNNQAQFHVMYGKSFGNQFKSSSFNQQYFRVGFSGLLPNI